MGYHGNHAISQGPSVPIFQKHCFLIQGGRICFGTNEKLSWGCNIGQIRFCGIGYPISVLI